MSCFRTANNKFFNGAPHMSDGRHFTDYRPNYDLNQRLISENNIENSHNYRNFLSQNSEKLMNDNRYFMARKNQLYKCKEPYHIGTMIPEKIKIVCNPHTCQRVLNDKNGIGEGRNYTTKENTILDPLMEPEYKFEDNICSLPEDNFNYYPLNQDNRNTRLRHSVSGGGNILNGGDPSVLY
jgi:hypothetical protein